MRPRDLGLGKLFERTQDAAIVADAKTQRIVLWNHAATNIFGYSTLEALGMRVEDLVPEPLKDQHRVGISRYAETGHGPYIDSPRLLELPAQRKGGEEIYIELSLSPIGLVKEADSSERYVLAIVHDITKRKRGEEDIRRLNQDLENRVAERTKQLEEREKASGERGALPELHRTKHRGYLAPRIRGAGPHRSKARRAGRALLPPRLPR